MSCHVLIPYFVICRQQIRDDGQHQVTVYRAVYRSFHFLKLQRHSVCMLISPLVTQMTGMLLYTD